MNSKLTFAEYERLAQRTDVALTGEKALMVPLLGLAGEVGSLLSEHKKRIRDGDRYTVFTDQVSEEIGDILWYLANIAAKSGLSLADIAAENLAKLEINPPLGVAAPDTPVQTMLLVAFSRWKIERMFEDSKMELGLDHFEARKYQAISRSGTASSAGCNSRSPASIASPVGRRCPSVSNAKGMMAWRK